MITVNNRDSLNWHENMTVAEVLKKMNYNYSLISVHINERYVPEDEYSTKKIPDNAKVQITHLAHGG